MPTASFQTFGTFSFGKATATAATVIPRPIYPFRQQKGAAVGVGQAASRPVPFAGTIHVTDFSYNIGVTGVHTITIMRPLNWTTFAADAAASQAAVVLTADPGVYSAGGYKYGLPNGQTAPRTANNVIAANDYFIFQCADGTWVTDTIASGTGTTPTMTTNLPTGGVLAGGLVYFFGITTDSDPATGVAHQQFDIQPASSNVVEYKLQSANGFWSALHEGDPLLLISNNLTTAGVFNVVAGYYGHH